MRQRPGRHRSGQRLPDGCSVDLRPDRSLFRRRGLRAVRFEHGVRNQLVRLSRESLPGPLLQRDGQLQHRLQPMCPVAEDAVVRPTRLLTRRSGGSVRQVDVRERARAPLAIGNRFRPRRCSTTRVLATSSAILRRMSSFQKDCFRLARAAQRGAGEGRCRAEFRRDVAVLIVSPAPVRRGEQERDGRCR